MGGASAGLTFREVMSGNVAEGSTEPHAGTIAGASLPLTMRGAVTIDDVDAFIKNPDHLGRLDVTFDWEPFGFGIAAPGGVFNLFSPTSDPDLTLMVYEWPATRGGRPFYFAGRKEVRRHQLSDLWKETTTLYLQVHDGPDNSGAIVAAGIIELSLEELIKMLPTFEAQGAQSAVDRARAITEFGRFFLGELWEKYVGHVRL